MRRIGEFMQGISADFVTPLFSAFAGASNADDFCKHLVHRVLRNYSAVGAIIGGVGNDSKCRKLGMFGEWILPSSGHFSLWVESPMAEVMHTGKTLLITTESKLVEKFPDFNVRLEGADCFLFAPFESTSKAIGFLGVGFVGHANASKLSNLELQLAVLAAEYVSISTGQHNVQSARASRSVAILQQGINEPNLSGRQLTILNFMSEGKTNYQIARLLNLSESTIKQESVRIFREFGATSRQEASELGKQLRLI